MSKAVIIVGDERRFLVEGRKLKEHLISDARFERVALIGSAYLAGQELDDRILRHLSSDPTAPLLLAYLGHGEAGVGPSAAPSASGIPALRNCSPGGPAPRSS